VFMCGFAPTVLFTLLGGVMVDRMPRARLMLGADLVRAGLVAILAVFGSAYYLELWHVYLASVLFGLVNAFFLPAYAALIPDVTPKHLLQSANALTSLSVEIAGIAGPALGAHLVNQYGVALAFALDAGSFLFAAGRLLPLLSLPLSCSARQIHTRIARDLRAGFQIIVASTWLWMIPNRYRAQHWSR
jgi:MFS family permease